MKEDKKAIYVLSDFVNNFIGKVGPIPDRKDIAEEWFNKVYLANANKWMERYQNNSMRKYAEKIIFAYSDEVIDREWRYKFYADGMTIDDFLGGNENGDD